MEALFEFLESRSRWFVLAVIAALTGLALVVEFVSPPEFPSVLLYLLPLAVSAWYGGPVRTTALWLLLAVLWYLLFPGDWGEVWYGLTHFALYALIAVMIFAYRGMYHRAHQRSTVDPLTTLLNRAGFERLSTDEFIRAQRYGHPISLLYIDVDDFKAVNDERGHAAGDELLRRIGHVLRGGLRRSDLAGRLGGDEFLVLLSETGSHGAAEAAREIHTNLIVMARRHDYPVTFSIGVVSYATPTVEFHEAVRRADQLMYEAKRAGKNRVEVEAA